MTEQSVVKIIGFITNPIREFHAPIPENYLEESEVPSSLLNELKAHGWQDSKGILWWDTDFRPDPVKGPDGHVYLLVGDVEINFASRFLERIKQATDLLNS